MGFSLRIIKIGQPAGLPDNLVLMMMMISVTVTIKIILFLFIIRIQKVKIFYMHYFLRTHKNHTK